MDKKFVAFSNDYLDFTKMHGAGNDYIFVDATAEAPEDAQLPELSRRVSDRHFGVGSDGLVLILPSDKADFRMRIFNADGSEAQMCGNATRCIGKYVYETGMTQNRSVTLETLGGIKVLQLDVKEGRVESVTVDMGEPQLLAASVPALSKNDNMVAEEISLNGETFRVTAVGMGNPHGVIFTDSLPDSLVLGKGPGLERHPAFPERANIEFAKILDRNNIEMRVWERGSGETLACGTGSCATAVAAALNGLADRDVTIHLRGGNLRIRWDEETNHVFMTGGATAVCSGRFFL